jgi:hypothetical protein
VDIKDVNDAHSKPWLEFGCAESPKEMIDLIGAGNLVSFRVSDSVEFLETCNERFDFIFLDGNHSAETVYKEVPPALKCLSKNGVILLHDFFPELRPLWPDETLENTIFHQSVIPGPFLAIQRLQRENNRLLVHPFGGLPWPTKLGSNVTRLALLSLKTSD